MQFYSYQLKASVQHGSRRGTSVQRCASRCPHRNLTTAVTARSTSKPPSNTDTFDLWSFACPRSVATQWSPSRGYRASWRLVRSRIHPFPAVAAAANARTARELTLDAAQATRGSRTSSRLLDRNQMRKLLDSRNDRDVLEGLRRVVAVRSPCFPALPTGQTPR